MTGSDCQMDTAALPAGAEGLRRQPAARTQGAAVLHRADKAVCVQCIGWCRCLAVLTRLPCVDNAWSYLLRMTLSSSYLTDPGCADRPHQPGSIWSNQHCPPKPLSRLCVLQELNTSFRSVALMPEGFPSGMQLTSSCTFNFVTLVSLEHAAPRTA